MFKISSVLWVFSVIYLQYVILVIADIATQGQPLIDNEFSCSCQKVRYTASSLKTDWFKAFTSCKQMGMELANIVSREEQVALEQYINSVPHKSGFYDGYWLGGTRHGAAPSDFIWFNTGKPLVYRKFAPGQPDNAGGQEACLQILILADGQIIWNDISCDANLYFICQSNRCS